jgi:2-deoxy-D-gluconate 3-dehydrogenase
VSSAGPVGPIGPAGPVGSVGSVADLFDLTGRTALVTGASSGIGRAIAVGLATAGADLVVHGRTERGLDQVVEEIRPTERRVTRWSHDLRDAGRLVERLQDLPRIDILVNNAGMIHRAPAEEYSQAAWRQVLAVNLDSVFELTRQLGTGMLHRGQGKVINIASLLSFQGGLSVTAYTVSKHGIAGLTRALANEWTGRGVQVNAIAPGYIQTANTLALRADPEREAGIRARIPAGRWGQPADVVGAAIFLASRASDYVAGQVLAVDGGWLAR